MCCSGRRQPGIVAAPARATEAPMIWRNPRRVVSVERLLENRFGRLRDVVSGPDGFLYVVTNNRDGRGTPTADDDRLLRLVPRE